MTKEPTRPGYETRHDYRSVEPLEGVDAWLARVFPFLNGTEPRAGEVGRDHTGSQYVRQPGHGWVGVQSLFDHSNYKQHDMEVGK